MPADSMELDSPPSKRPRLDDPMRGWADVARAVVVNDRKDPYHPVAVIWMLFEIIQEGHKRALVPVSPTTADRGFFRDIEALRPVLKASWEAADASIVLRDPVFHDAVTAWVTANVPKDNRTGPLRAIPGYRQANIDAWKAPYHGSYHRLALDHIAKYWRRDWYARSGCIVQSSGMGKSRMVNEMAKLVPIVPINFRPLIEDSWFPPSDVHFDDYLLSTGDEESQPYFFRCSAFLTALFVHVEIELRNARPQTRFEAAECLYHLFNNGMTFLQHGEQRGTFGKAVVETAELLRAAYHTEKNEDLPSLLKGTFKSEASPVTLEEAATKLQDLLDSLALDTLHDASWPTFIVAFDGLNMASWQGSNVYEGIRRAARGINHVRVFFLFLSTTSKEHRFPPSPRNGNDISQRFPPPPRVMDPFTLLGLDHFAKPLGKTTTLQDVTSLEWMASLGRPFFGAMYKNAPEDVQNDMVYFAAVKLSGGKDYFDRGLDEHATFAAIATRIPFEFHTVNSKVFEAEHVQIENHMRVCIKFESDSVGAITLAASEPLVAEAAVLLWDKMESTAEALLHAYRYSGKSQDDEAETYLMYVTLAAVDQARRAGLAHGEIPTASSPRTAPLLAFLSALVAEPWREAVLRSLPHHSVKNKTSHPLKEEFKDAQIYCTHFIRLYRLAGLTLDHLCHLAARGAFILCPIGQPAVNAMGFFVLRPEEALGPRNLGILLFQSKNWDNASPNLDGLLFHAMTLHDLGICSKEDAQDVPIIRIVMQFGARSANIQPRDPATKLQLPHTAKNAPGDGQEFLPLDNYTAYDIWFAGASSATFGCIKKEDDGFVEQVLNLHKMTTGFETTSNDELEKRDAVVAQEMYPCASDAAGHWQWTCRGEDTVGSA